MERLVAAITRPRNRILRWPPTGEKSRSCSTCRSLICTGTETSPDLVTVIDKYDQRTTRTFHREDRLFHEPFQHGINGEPLDTVIDWAGLPRTATATQKGQALLITMAANAVLEDRRSPDYWEAEKRWLRGDFLQVIEEKSAVVRKHMDI